MNLPLFTKFPVENLLIVSAVIFCCGIYTIITRKNAVSILMGIELVLNAANINLIAFNQYVHPAAGRALIDGPVFVLFVIVLAAAEAAVALAIILGLYRNLGKAEVERATQMKG